ncbi:hypothetical protein OG21DRAFT_1498014 [Imleria badia]|nr:hypothetical protein OG21DRAFT_1498014 [Imleria badia]
MDVFLQSAPDVKYISGLGLGMALLNRFNHLGELSDLEQAVSRLSDTVDLTLQADAPLGSRDLEQAIATLRLLLISPPMHLGDLNDPEELIPKYRDAVDLAPEGHSGKPLYMDSLGTAFKALFKLLEDFDDLEQAISTHRNVVDLTPDAHPDKPDRVNNLGAAFVIHSDHLKRLGAHSWAACVSICPTTSGSSKDARFSSYEELSSFRPDHARRLRKLSTALEHASVACKKSFSSLSLEQEANRHRMLAIERDKLLQALPGFERFLIHKESSQLRASAHSGPVYSDQASDFVFSSYVPTLSILVPLAPKPQAASRDDLRLLTVPQPPSDGQSSLSGVEIELTRSHIRTMIQNAPLAQSTLIESSMGTVEEVLTLMKDADWAHFSCHGIQHADYPTCSGLCLADGRRLKLSDIIALSRHRGRFAFLSAWQTATGYKNLSDETIHIAAGMLFAGYGGVVDTMWSISDRLAPRVAKDVYEHLFRNGTRPDYREVARALHDAVGRLRDRTPFVEWLPFIHVGL